MSEQMVSILKLLLLLKEDYKYRREQSSLGKNPGRCGAQGSLASPTQPCPIEPAAKIVSGGPRWSCVDVCILSLSLFLWPGEVNKWVPLHQYSGFSWERISHWPWVSSSSQWSPCVPPNLWAVVTGSRPSPVFSHGCLGSKYRSSRAPRTFFSTGPFPARCVLIKEMCWNAASRNYCAVIVSKASFLTVNAAHGLQTCICKRFISKPAQNLEAPAKTNSK